MSVWHCARSNSEEITQTLTLEEHLSAKLPLPRQMLIMRNSGKGLICNQNDCVLFVARLGHRR